MFSKILNKLKSVFSKKSVTVTSKPKKQTQVAKAPKKNKATKAPKATKTKKVAKLPKATKTKKVAKLTKSKKQDKKLIIDSFSSIPGIGVKSALAFYEAGFKSTNEIISAPENDLLSVPGVGINLVKKIKGKK